MAFILSITSIYAIILIYVLRRFTDVIKKLRRRYFYGKQIFSFSPLLILGNIHQMPLKSKILIILNIEEELLSEIIQISNVGIEIDF